MEKQYAVSRAFEIMGEATKNISSSFKEKHQKIEWKKIAGMRDIIVHTYFKVDFDIVWNIFENNLPELKEKIKRILE